VRIVLASSGVSLDGKRARLDASIRHAKRPIARLVGRSVGWTGKDVTAAVAHRSCLILAPHPDDETLGCAVTVMRKVAAGTPVHVVVVTDGRNWPPDRDPADNITTRARELREACRLLGLGDRDLTHWSLAPDELSPSDESLIDAVADAVRTHRPDDILCTSEADPHGDHAALAIAARTAVAGSNSRLLAYPIWQWERPRRWVRMVQTCSWPEKVSTDGYLERKREIFTVFRSQLSGSAGGDLVGMGLSPTFLGNFLGSHEMFFRVPMPSQQARPSAIPTS
jgi:LmbE family N-acetylglucosaminyl deacetylase